MEYLNIGSVFIGILLILGFFNADAIFREPALSDPFEEDPEGNSTRQTSKGALLEPSKMFSRENLMNLADEMDMPVTELERRLNNNDDLESIAITSGISEKAAQNISNKYGIDGGQGYLQ